MRSRVSLACAAVALAAAAWAALSPERGSIALLLAAGAVIVAAAAWLEDDTASMKELALVATLGGVAAAGRVLFAFVPGVQPVTVITVAAGAALGVRAGVMVGALAAIASNFFLGQGIWTPWQMIAWGGCGALAGLLARFLRRRIVFALVCFVLGFAFSGLMDVWMWFSFYPHTWGSFAVVMARGLPFDVFHAVGNLLIALAVGPELRRILERYERRLRPEIVWA